MMRCFAPSSVFAHPSWSLPVLNLNRANLSIEPINVAVNDAIERAASTTAELPRPYLGASIVGHECARRIQYDWWCTPVLPARTREIFDRGHYFEERARRLLTAIGFKFAPPEAVAFNAADGALRGHAAAPPSNAINWRRFIRSPRRRARAAYLGFGGRSPSSAAFLQRNLPGAELSRRCGSASELCAVPGVRWRNLVTLAKGAVEVRNIAKPDVVCDRADAAGSESWVAQHTICLVQTLPKDKLREGHAFALEQLVHVPRRHAVACRDGGDGQRAILQIGGDVALDRL